MRPGPAVRVLLYGSCVREKARACVHVGARVCVWAAGRCTHGHTLTHNPHTPWVGCTHYHTPWGGCRTQQQTPLFLLLSVHAPVLAPCKEDHITHTPCHGYQSLRCANWKTKNHRLGAKYGRRGTFVRCACVVAATRDVGLGADRVIVVAEIGACLPADATGVPEWRLVDVAAGDDDALRRCTRWLASRHVRTNARNRVW